MTAHIDCGELAGFVGIFLVSSSFSTDYFLEIVVLYYYYTKKHWFRLLAPKVDLTTSWTTSLCPRGRLRRETRRRPRLLGKSRALKRWKFQRQSEYWLGSLRAGNRGAGRACLARAAL